jgi:hypothetical protein
MVDPSLRGKPQLNGGKMLMKRLLMKVYYVLTVPVAVLFVLSSAKIHEEYRMSLPRKLRLGMRMFLNNLRVRGTSCKVHLAMALKILETPPDVQGDIVECGTWKGCSAINLSLVCKIVGRKLRLYDSFEGLPEGDPLDREAKSYKKGDFAGTLDEVKSNITKYGAIECCEFVKGWFKDTLPKLDSRILLAYLDVDLEASLHTCVKYIWPCLADRGYVFTDECVGTDYVALFYSEKWWRKYFDKTPPGLIGAGTGLSLGEFYIGPYSERKRKDMSGYWAYYPEDDGEQERQLEDRVKTETVLTT